MYGVSQWWHAYNITTLFCVVPELQHMIDITNNAPLAILLQSRYTNHSSSSSPLHVITYGVRWWSPSHDDIPVYYWQAPESPIDPDSGLLISSSSMAHHSSLMAYAVCCGWFLL